MAQRTVNINDNSISKNVTSDYRKAICEYIWNGFDANATKININYKSNELGAIEKLEIKDNGDGIDRAELDQTFGCFQDSIKKNTFEWSSQIKGKQGKGRYSFNCFATDAEWISVFSKDDKRLEHKILIKAGNNHHYDDGKPEDLKITSNPTGTIVKFYNVNLLSNQLEEDEFRDYLKKEFAVFLHLNKTFGKNIFINDERLDYETLIAESEFQKIEIEYENEIYSFDINFIRWNEKIKDNYMIYFLDENMFEHHEIPTSLNKKDTEFHHSVCVSSIFFNEYKSKEKILDESFEITKTQKNKVFNNLIKQIKEFLLLKQKYFINKIGANVLIEKYKKAGIIQEPKNEYEGYIIKDLINTVRCIYCAQPKIFINLHLEQAKTLIGFLELLLQTDKRNDILQLLDKIIKLNEEERHNLVEVLQHAELSNITETIKLLQNRCRIISCIKNAVQNKELKMNEVHDLQPIIANAFWIFGEEYNIVTEAEPDFEQALNKYISQTHIKVKGKSKSKRNKPKIDHIDKNKEMDIFAFRQNIQSETIENIVIELKHPDIKLGEIEVSQVKTYMSVITSVPEFNASNMTWKFYLVGNEFDSSDYISREIRSNIMWGKKGLIQHVEENGIVYEIYVKKWSEIFTDFEIRHNFLLKKLELKRKSLIVNPISKNDIHSTVKECS